MEEPDCGGPTSDWPARIECDHGAAPASGADEDDEEPTDNGKSPVVDEPKRDAGKPASIHMDAGAPVVPLNPGESAGSGSYDGGAYDGAAHPELDGGLDGGAPQNEWCGPSLDGGARSVCADPLCAADFVALPKSNTGACLGSADLTLVCSGELADAVERCTQEDALSLGLGGTVSACARAAPGLEDASALCIDCYVDETLCAVNNCLTPCLAGLSTLCTECRRTRCGSAFESCSGLSSSSAR